MSALQILTNASQLDSIDDAINHAQREGGANYITLTPYTKLAIAVANFIPDAAGTQSPQVLRAVEEYKAQFLRSYAEDILELIPTEHWTVEGTRALARLEIFQRAAKAMNNIILTDFEAIQRSNVYSPTPRIIIANTLFGDSLRAINRSVIIKPSYYTGRCGNIANIQNNIINRVAGNYIWLTDDSIYVIKIAAVPFGAGEVELNIPPVLTGATMADCSISVVTNIDGLPLGAYNDPLVVNQTAAINLAPMEGLYAGGLSLKTGPNGIVRFANMTVEDVPEAARIIALKFTGKLRRGDICPFASMYDQNNDAFFWDLGITNLLASIEYRKPCEMTNNVITECYEKLHTRVTAVMESLAIGWGNVVNPAVHPFQVSKYIHDVAYSDAPPGANVTIQHRRTIAMFIFRALALLAIYGS